MKRYIFASLLIVFLGCFNVSAESNRDYVKKSIKSWGSARNVAITRYGGDVALYGKNGYSCSGVPVGLKDALKSLHDKGEFIDDVQLTDNGRWLVLYGTNGFIWNNLPYSLERKLREYNSNGEIVTSVTFNDAGDWIIISTEHVAASTTEIYGWIEDGMYQFGQLWAAHITDDGLALCYAEGYKFLGNVPYRLKDKLSSSKLNVFRIKFLSDGSYFFADRNGYYSYYM